MTSPFARYQTLSQRTLDAYALSTSRNRTIVERTDFYGLYLQDLAPLGITVHHVPVEPDDRGPAVWATNSNREEILLMTNSGKIFMSGLVSLDFNACQLERTAGDEAYTNWLKGEFTPGGGGDTWRFFTGHATLRLFSSHRSGEWEAKGNFHPIQQADEVAAFLQQEFDKLPLHERR